MTKARITIGLLITAVAAVIAGCTPASEAPADTARHTRPSLRTPLLRHTRPRP